MSALTWNALFNSGSIVSLTTSLWRAQVKLRASDLGLESSKEVRKAISLGRYRLAPAKAFEGLMEPAREAARLVDAYSVNFSAITGARYVPEKNLARLLEELRSQRKRFSEAVEDFVANYDKVKNEMLPIIEKALQDAAKDPESAAQAYDRLQAEYPTAEQVRAKFGLTWSVYSLQTPKSQAAAELASEETEKVKGVIGEMVKQLRDEMTEKLKAILGIVVKGGKLPERSIESALSLLDRVESLNIMGDAVLSEQVSAVRSYLASVDRGKVGEDFVSGLSDVQKTLETSLEQAVAEAEANLTGLGRRKLAASE